WLLLTSFGALAITGFALVYPDVFLGLGVTEATRHFIHRVAAVVMLAAGVYHVLYVALTNEGRRWVADMLPKWSDLTGAKHTMACALGLRAERPLLARFGYAEKLEYWAVVWGTVVMGGTGLMVWFKVGMFGLLARWWVDVAVAVHFYEAVLATLAIL